MDNAIKFDFYTLQFPLSPAGRSYFGSISVKTSLYSFLPIQTNNKKILLCSSSNKRQYFVSFVLTHNFKQKLKEVIGKKTP